MIKIGVLAIQGAFIEHRHTLERLGIDSFEIRRKTHLSQAMDGLIIPGGESTVMGKLMRELELFDRLKHLIEDGMPTLGTCAGLLVLARKLVNDERIHLGTMDITAKRNAYGRQLGSFHTQAEFEGLGEIPMTFIRAPYIEEVGREARVLARVDGKIVAARQGKQLVTAFHPELNDAAEVHNYFIKLIGM